MLVPVEDVAIVHKSVLVTVFARHDHCPTRPTNRVRAKAVSKQHSLRGEFVDIRSRVDRLEPAIVEKLDGGQRNALRVGR